MNEGEVSLPKSLRRYEVEDLWAEKRKNHKLQLLGSEKPSKEVEKPKYAEFSETHGSPFTTNRKLFRLQDYKNIKYEEK